MATTIALLALAVAFLCRRRRKRLETAMLRSYLELGDFAIAAIREARGDVERTDGSSDELRLIYARETLEEADKVWGQMLRRHMVACTEVGMRRPTDDDEVSVLGKDWRLAFPYAEDRHGVLHP